MYICFKYSASQIFTAGALTGGIATIQRIVKAIRAGASRDALEVGPVVICFATNDHGPVKAPES